MVDPPPTPVEQKDALREQLRALRRYRVAALPGAARALMFHCPPSPVAALAGPGSGIGLYAARADEAPTRAYATWFHERGHPLALPWFADRASPMRFRRWRDPFDEDELEPGPFRIPQPCAASEEVEPNIVFVPVIGFTADGERLGQGAGHYDRWLAAHPAAIAIGLAWDCQLVESLPLEQHDRPLAMVVTPTRLYRNDEAG